MLRPRAVRVEQAIWRDLLSDREQQSHYAEFLLEALLRGDSQARASFYKSGIENQWLTPNEVRPSSQAPRPEGEGLGVRASEGEVLIQTPGELRDLVRAPNGVFRPLATATDLPGGWRVEIGWPEKRCVRLLLG